MVSLALGRLRRLDPRLTSRAILAVAIYAAAAALLLVSVVALRRSVSTHDLRALLGFIFISSTVAGLEPGTVKAAALQPRGAMDRPRASVVLASALKAVVVAPFVGLVWRFAEPQTPWSVVSWLPLVCVAGFTVTDLRVLLDLQGRHAAALGLKQGLSAGAHALAALLLILGLPIAAAIGVSTLVRLAAVAAAAMRLGVGVAAPPSVVWREARAMLGDPRWLDFAATSALGSVSGSADRIIGLRYLPAADYSAYYLTFESLSRFWLIPFLLAPIVFARRVGGQASRRLVAGARMVTAVAGIALIIGVFSVFAFAPSLIASLVGARLMLPTLALSVAVVLGSFAQLRMTQLQAAGWSRMVLIVTIVTGAVSAVAFLIAALKYGAAGLMYAWVVRSAFELAFLMCVGSADHGPSGADTPGRSPAAADS